MLFQAAVMCSWPTLALYVEQLGVARDAVASTTGLVVFAAGLPAMLMATAWSRLGRRIPPLAALTAALLLSGAANLAMGLAGSLPAVFALRACAGAGMAGFVPLTFEWMNARAPAGARGRMAGLGSTAMMIGNVIGPLAGGWLAVHVGLAATFWVPGALLAAAGALLLVRRLGGVRFWGRVS
jgi:DHA1 family multidrug resistance protein-like MFS transporter